MTHLNCSRAKWVCCHSSKICDLLAVSLTIVNNAFYQRDNQMQHILLDYM